MTNVLNKKQQEDTGNLNFRTGTSKFMKFLFKQVHMKYLFKKYSFCKGKSYPAFHLTEQNIHI